MRQETQHKFLNFACVKTPVYKTQITSLKGMLSIISANLLPITYLTNHPILGNRLLKYINQLLIIKNKTALELFGEPDNLKLNSCMTLFTEYQPSI
jgi:hypothetical protein